MAAIMEKHLETRTVLVGKNVSVAEFIAAYTLDMTSMLRLLECLPSLHLYLERRYARPRGAPRIVQAFAAPNENEYYATSPY